MPYAEGLQSFVDRTNAHMPPDFYLLPLDRQRRLYETLADVFPYPLPEDVTIETHEFSPQGRLRIYRPHTPRGEGVLFYIRGGGFVVGSLETHNTLISDLAHRTGLVTVAPDFSLSPEAPFPTALEDCYAALCTVAADGAAFDLPSGPIVLGGDSSGGNMAVVLCMMARDRKGPRIAGQALISPVLDFTRWAQGGEDAPLLTGGEMEYYVRCYCGSNAVAREAYVSPLISGMFHDLPPAYVMGAELDSLAVDSRRYAALLAENGARAELVIEEGLVHAAMRARGLSAAVEAAWARYCAAAAALAGVVV